MNAKKIAHATLIGVFLLLALNGVRAQEPLVFTPHLQSLSLTDSVIQAFSIEELERFRSYYSRERERLKWEREELRKQGIRDAELFLSRNPRTRVGDKILMRLAELYYEQEQEEFSRRMQEYDRLYSLYERDQLDEAPPEPQRDFSRALVSYQTVVDRYSNSDLVDDALYNIGVLLEDSQDPDSALTIYQKIIKDFPESKLQPDVLMRIGEYHFNPPRNAVVRAIDYYQQVLAFKESPRYDEALYRLGWCFYRLSDYDKAISYFTILADDIQTVLSYDPLLKYTNPSLMDESVEYIGLSFLEKGGPDDAADYLRSIGGRDYGAAILRRMGDAYMQEKEDYPRAIRAFELIIEFYPNHAQAPTIQGHIVQCRRRMGEEALAFLARDLLFTRYREGSDWWDANIDKNAREQAYILSESALRDNVTFLFNRAQETDRGDLYYQMVTQSRRYLQTFPKDSSAALIHWNMALTLDTKLRQTGDAYNEYMRISTLYWNSQYQHYAAKNAVALAREAAEDTLAQVKKRVSEEKIVSLSDLADEAEKTGQARFNFRARMQLLETPLSLEEERLARAYDNYIKLFPHEEETPLFLANAGALYYRHHQFKNALKYFKTLLRHFPGSEQVNQARFAILESYFGNADFGSSEIVARRIIADPDASLELVSRARRRLAESIFLNAEMLAESDRHLEAGNEYRRMVNEAPESTFTDLALFNAALEYDKASEFMRAIETYTLLLATHPQSGYVYDAQNNLAFDYVELGDFHNAALTYERLADIHPEENKARDALYNSSFYFAKAEDWQNAIKINRLFLQRFPQDREAANLSFEIAGFHRQSGESDQAHQSLGDFIAGFPDHPRVIEAFFRRGNYLAERNQPLQAVSEYQKALSTNRERVQVGMESDDYYAAESEFAMAMLKYKEFEKIEFLLPSADMARTKERKKDLLLEIIRHLNNCTTFGTNRIYEATFMIGRAYQEFARTWSDQEIPDMDAVRRIVAQKEVNDAARVLYERSAEAYRNGIQVLNRLGSTYRSTLLREAETAASIPVDTLAIVAQDTILRAVDRWSVRSKENLSQVNFESADISLKTARIVANAPVPPGLGDFPQLVYKKQVIDSVVVPIIRSSLDGYRLCLIEADSLQINSQWVELAKQKLVSTKHLAASYYQDLTRQGFDLIGKNFDAYSDRVFGEGSFDDHFYDLQVIAQDATNSITFSLATIMNSLDRYAEAIRLAGRMDIEEHYIVSSRDSMMITAYNFALQADSLSRYSKRLADQAREGFLKTESLLLEEGLFAFNSNYFALRDMEREILENGYSMAQDLEISNLYSKNLTLQLVRFDPEEYAGLIGLSISSFSVVTDSSWKAYPNYTEGWTLGGFDDSNWGAAMIVDPAVDDAWSAIWVFAEKDTIVSATEEDSTQVHVLLQPATTAFFRKAILVQGLPVGCTIRYIPHPDVTLFFNGDLVKRTEGTDFKNSDGVVDVSELLVDGSNVLAVEVKGTEASTQKFSARVELRSLPEWDQRVRMLNPEFADKETQEKVLIERSRIP
ncbi:tetratricopeptide repeat protein [candidate division KSB1 bacterium]|nr:tetratricopeptide repeat protein [candidate division KSB1 bacterium]